MIDNFNFFSNDTHENELIIYHSKERFKLIKDRSLIHLIDYHRIHKYLFMTYNKNILTKMGNLTANKTNQNIKDIYQKYSQYLDDLFEKPFSKKNRINVLEHMYGYFKKNITNPDKKIYFVALENYRSDKVTFSIPLNIINNLAIKFRQNYLLEQIIFNPY